MSSEASPDTRLHESNRLAHELCRAYIRWKKALTELRYANVMESKTMISNASQHVANTDMQLFQAKTAYERFIIEEKPEVAG